MRSKKAMLKENEEYKEIPSKIANTKESGVLLKIISIISSAIAILGLIGSLIFYSYRFGKLEENFRLKIEHQEKYQTKCEIELKELKEKVHSNEKEIYALQVRLNGKSDTSHQTK